jgi:PadR family transcriptional regulator AphA
MNRKPTPKTTTLEAVLGVLSMAPMTGYEIRQRIQDSVGNFWSESFGQIYPSLTKLHKQGMVHAEESGKLGRKVYSLTPLGKERVHQWVMQMPQPRKPRNEMLLKLFFANMGETAKAREQVVVTRERFAMDLLRFVALEPELMKAHQANPALPYYRMTLHYGMAEARAVIQWADETLQVLDEMSQSENSFQGVKDDTR